MSAIAQQMLCLTVDVDELAAALVGAAAAAAGTWVKHRRESVLRARGSLQTRSEDH